jgi:hypothetical protein
VYVGVRCGDLNTAYVLIERCDGRRFSHQYHLGAGGASMSVCLRLELPLGWLSFNHFRGIAPGALPVCVRDRGATLPSRSPCGSARVVPCTDLQEINWVLKIAGQIEMRDGASVQFAVYPVPPVPTRFLSLRTRTEDKAKRSPCCSTFFFYRRTISSQNLIRAGKTERDGKNST